MRGALLTLGWLLATPAAAQDFDYYVLALSWSPNWCALEGRAEGSEQCDPEADLGWVLHGLWPQWEEGWPQYCDSRFPDPSRRETAAMADITGTGGLAWHAWNKHGTCSGLSPQDYFALSREAYGDVAIPDVFERLPRPVELPASVVEEAFLKADARLRGNGVTVTCRDGHIQEVRLCLTPDLEPRRCGADVIRDCRGNALMEPVP
ncbi:ribonuclease T [Rubellimicrobium rubrum]|uniref:Ribonuclease T n=1 Tax=Rubellimicrobium rubrum TaxID=2585369 RepID=A0A5C4MTZ5_9RHOB|nr:ribonuclease T2 [Rubellimicrobium rubrum]TNC49374.1 ribonuclease T [Rubellimicrobium rubrum]